MSALSIKCPIQPLIKKTIFKQFCGGNTRETLPLIKLMYTKNVHSVLDYSVEGKETEEDFDKAAETKIEIIKFASTAKELPFAVAKPTGLGRFEIWEKVLAEAVLTDKETEEWDRIQARLYSIAEAAVKYDTKLLIDAEESWMQKAADDLCFRLMQEFNKEKTYVYNTLQCYKWDRLSYVKEIHEYAQANNFRLGFKIVRCLHGKRK